MRGSLTDSACRLGGFGLSNTAVLTKCGSYPHRSTPAAPVLYVPFSDLGGGIACADYRFGAGAQPTHTRASTAWTRLANGLWTSVAAGNLRSYYNEDGVYCGALFEQATANYCLWNRDLTNAVWTTTGSPTIAKDGTGMDGVANSCSTVTCGAAGDTVGQTVVLASQARQGAFWLKRLVGTGTVEVTIDGGTTWTDVTSQLSTSHFRFCAPPVQTLTNPNLVLRMGTPGDKVAVEMALIQLSYNGTYNAIDTPIETGAAAVTRNVDALGAFDAANVDATEGTLYAEVSSLWERTGNARRVADVVAGSPASQGLAYVAAGDTPKIIRIGDASTFANAQDTSSSMFQYPQRLATFWGTSTYRMGAVYSGVLGNNTLFDGVIGATTGLHVSASTSLRGCIKELRIWKHQLDINVMAAVVNRSGR